MHGTKNKRGCVSEKKLANLSEFGTTIGATYQLEADRSVTCLITLEKRHQGPPGHAHGGLLAALIDEAMGAAAWATGRQVVAVHLEFDLKRAVPLGVQVRVHGFVTANERRKVLTTGTVTLPDGAVAVQASGVFVEAPHFFEDLSNPLKPA